MKIITFPLEDRVRFYSNLHIKISRRRPKKASFSFTGKANTVSSINAGRNFNGQRLGLLKTTLTLTIRAKIFNNSSRSAASRAGLLHLQKTMLYAHLPTPTTALASN
nr:grpE [Candidatus Coxiella mudrowiae]